jgi:putative thiamine transport system substrate-binding protein
MKISVFVALSLSLSLSTAVNADWSKIQNEARGQTVYFNAWGGNEGANAYIVWAAKEVKTRYGVDVRHVKVNSTAEVVKRVQTEVAVGRTGNGSVDLLWLNSEHFRHLKSGGLLFGPWAQNLPNWGLVDLNKPVRSDFSTLTEGYESPWGTAQLTFMADRAQTPEPPRGRFPGICQCQPRARQLPQTPLCALTTVMRITAGIQLFRSTSPQGRSAGEH